MLVSSNKLKIRCSFITQMFGWFTDEIHHVCFVCRSLRRLTRCSVEEEFPHLYANGCTLRDVCAECTKFVVDVISSSRRSLDILNNTPKKEAAAAQRPQLQRQSNVEAFPRPTAPHHLQHTQPYASSPSPSLQLHCAETINSVSHWVDQTLCAAPTPLCTHLDRHL